MLMRIHTIETINGWLCEGVISKPRANMPLCQDAHLLIQEALIREAFEGASHTRTADGRHFPPRRSHGLSTAARFANGIGRFANTIFFFTTATMRHPTVAPSLPSRLSALRDGDGVSSSVSMSVVPLPPTLASWGELALSPSRWMTASGFGRLATLPSRRWCPIKRERMYSNCQVIDLS